MSEGQKEELTLQALGLLNEQVQARIVHYKGEMETSPELDAITAQVVAQLKAMQQAAAQETTTRRSGSSALETLGPRAQPTRATLKPKNRRARMKALLDRIAQNR